MLHCKQSIIDLKYALLDILFMQKKKNLIFYYFGMKCHSLDCTTSHFKTNTKYRAYFNQKQKAIFTRDIERERVRVQFRRARIWIVLSVFSLIACFFLFTLFFSLLLMSTPCFIVLLWEERTPLQSDYLVKRRFGRGIRTTDCCGCSDK